jgi:SAM-dependent methyltransferase
MNDVIYYHRDTCRLCKSHNVDLAINLKAIPVNNPNLGDGNKLSQDLLVKTEVPLDIYRCTDCGMIQLLDMINPKVQYMDFRYQTSISLGLPQHFKDYANKVLEKYATNKAPFVIEIGSNDGTLLSSFQEHGCKVLGIDPSQPVSDIAISRGVPTIIDFFSRTLGMRVQREYGKADIVICNNTFANLDKLDDFLSGVKCILSDNGVLLIETAHGLSVIKNLQIDTVYHEHLSYFLITSLDKWFISHNMEIIDVDTIKTKGGSLRIAIQLNGGFRTRQESVDKIIQFESNSGILSKEPFYNFSKRLNNAQTEITSLMKKTISKGEKIAGYGASVGSLTLLYQLGLTPYVDFFIDDKPLTESILLPTRDIPVYDKYFLMDEMPSVVIIFAFRYAEDIMSKNRDYLNAGGCFVVPIPQLKIIHGDQID